MSGSRRAAVRHCESSIKDCAEDVPSGGITIDYQQPTMGSTSCSISNCSLMPGSGANKEAAIQTNDSELSHEGLVTSPYTYGAPPQVENQMKRELKYFFMNPHEKYTARGRKPWKLAIQIIKIVLVTTQLCLFGSNQFSVTGFLDENSKAFEHLFLKDWSSTYDSGVYPSTKTLYALYEVQELYKHTDHLVAQYSNLKSVALGTYVLPPEQKITVSVHEYEKFDAKEEYYVIDLNTTCVKTIINITENMKDFHFEQFMAEQNQSINFDRLRKMTLNFAIRSVHIRESKNPNCRNFNVSVIYDNTPHSGRFSVRLSQNSVIDRNCSKETQAHSAVLETFRFKAGVTFMDILIICLCIFSSILCTRSLINGYHLKKKTSIFFECYFKRKLTRSERMEFVNLWYVMIIFSDCFTLSGTLCKICIQYQVWDDFDTCSLLLGAGCFLVWFGILRYLGFFHSYSIPIITLKCAMPNVLRFLLCAAIMYLAYGFAGWVVMGPYHKKFETLDISIECMFSLINGDDMFATFRAMSDDTNTLIYYFSRVYLYSFISLFIYVVLSLFIAVIMDTYETVKQFRERGECENELQAFIKQCEESPDSGCFRVSSNKPIKRFFDRCCKNKPQLKPEDYSSLVE